MHQILTAYTILENFANRPKNRFKIRCSQTFISINIIQAPKSWDLFALKIFIVPNCKIDSQNCKRLYSISQYLHLIFEPNWGLNIMNIIVKFIFICLRNVVVLHFCEFFVYFSRIFVLAFPFCLLTKLTRGMAWTWYMRHCEIH